MVFFTESWFWRGTQSAVFYYVSCTPYVEYKHKKKRRREAERSRKDKDVVFTQPGAVSQPAPFETNPAWAAEIVRGPHPPKGWKRDPLYYEFASRAKDEDTEKVTGARPRADTANSTASPAQSDLTATTGTSTAVNSLRSPEDIHLQTISFGANAATDDPYHACSNPISAVGGQNSNVSHYPHWHGRSSTAVDDDADHSVESLKKKGSSETCSTSSNSATPVRDESRPKRPSMEKQLSTAMDGFKEAMRAAWHPEQWNWIRYDRDDEILSGLNERARAVWGNMRERLASYGEEANVRLRAVETQASVESESQRWQRGINPPINEMHPPIVSQLPSSREAARWMLLPPASADVMMGKARPDPFNDHNRKPLCVIGREESESTVQYRSASLDREMVGSDDEADSHSEHERDEHEWVPGFAHIQRPQLPHFWMNRASYGP